MTALYEGFATPSEAGFNRDGCFAIVTAEAAAQTADGPVPIMTDRFALVLGLLILGLLVLDLGVLHTGATLFLARKLADLVEYISFWR